jgi:hypothetical protein
MKFSVHIMLFKVNPKYNFLISYNKQYERDTQSREKFL